MAEVINMPRLSDTMEEGTVVKWHFKVGDTVSEGDILAEIETDKAIQEFESEFDGTLLFIGAEEGTPTKVDGVLAIIGADGENISALQSDESQENIEEKVEPQTVAQQKESVTIPEGVEIITMPRLSDTMEQGTVAAWLFKKGDTVSEGDILAEIETDKAVQEFESEFDGVLLHVGVATGESTPVDSILAIIGPAGTDVSDILANGGIPTEETSNKVVENTVQKTEETSTPPHQEEVLQETSTSSKIFASPLAKKIAKDKGYNLSKIKGSGENGRIIKVDVENYKEVKETTPSKVAVAVQSFVPAGAFKTANSQMRKVIARRLGESKFSAPHYYLNIEIDMENTMANRKAINTIPDTKISFNDMVVKASAMALRKHPQINSTWTDTEIITHGNINIGVAVAVEDGLLVPVLNNADSMSFTQISAEVKDKAFRAKQRKLNANEMEGSTFTISNLGMFGIESFTSIINQPNSCILSVGTIVEKPVVKNGQIVVGHTMKVTLACDHRTVDGATGSAFLQTLKLLLENPVAMLA